MAQQLNFHENEVVQISDVPGDINGIRPFGDLPTTVGKLRLFTTAPAIANAVQQDPDKRVRHMAM